MSKGKGWPGFQGFQSWLAPRDFQEDMKGSTMGKRHEDEDEDTTGYALELARLDVERAAGEKAAPIGGRGYSFQDCDEDKCVVHVFSTPDELEDGYTVLGTIAVNGLAGVHFTAEDALAMAGVLREAVSGARQAVVTDIGTTYDDIQKGAEAQDAAWLFDAANDYE